MVAAVGVTWSNMDPKRQVMDTKWLSATLRKNRYLQHILKSCSAYYMNFTKHFDAKTGQIRRRRRSSLSLKKLWGSTEVDEEQEGEGGLNKNVEPAEKRWTDYGKVAVTNIQ